jgi:hypothetical protein
MQTTQAADPSTQSQIQSIVFNVFTAIFALAALLVAVLQYRKRYQAVLVTNRPDLNDEQGER